MSIVNDKIHFAPWGRVLQFPCGPIISPRPGPTLEIAEAEAENAVKKSKLKKLKDIEANIKISI